MILIPNFTKGESIKETQKFILKNYLKVFEKYNLLNFF